MSAGNFNTRGGIDLAVGAPGEDGKGRVSVLHGGSGGLSTRDDYIGDLGPNAAGGRYGAAIA